jgi:hypothetical protein
MNLCCDSCGVASFKTNQAYQRHIQSNKHKLRQVNTRKDLLQCDQCNKWYCGKTGLTHHKYICNISKVSIQLEPHSVIAGEAILQQQMDEMKLAFEKERQEMKLAIEESTKERLAFEESMKEQINRILETHAGSGTGTTNNTNFNHVETQNVNININAFGHETTDYLDDKAIIACIGRVFKSIPSLLEKLHFDPQHPENHNIKITNKKLPYASVMGDNQKWKTVDRKDAIEKMVLNGYNILDEKYTENKDKIPASKQKHFEGFQTKFEAEDKDTMKQIKSEVDMMVLNGIM